MFQKTNLLTFGYTVGWDSGRATCTVYKAKEYYLTPWLSMLHYYTEGCFYTHVYPHPAEGTG